MDVTMVPDMWGTESEFSQETIVVVDSNGTPLHDKSHFRICRTNSMIAAVKVSFVTASDSPRYPGVRELSVGDIIAIDGAPFRIGFADRSMTVERV